MQEADEKLLARLAEQEAQDQHIQSARREKARADAAWMKKVNSACSLVTAVNGAFLFCFQTHLRLVLTELSLKWFGSASVLVVRMLGS